MESGGKDEGVRLAEKLCAGHRLAAEEFERLILGRTPALAEHLARAARQACRKVYGNEVFGRALIEITNYCRNDCRYCGLRRSNRQCARYRMDADRIVECAQGAYEAGFRTFVIQGGEDPAMSDSWLCSLVGRLKGLFPDCAITLSVGERSPQSYRFLHESGAERYLLRHETASSKHYAQLHPLPLTLDRRLACLEALRKAGFVVGAGFMVGSPGQTAACLAADLSFIQTFRPEMCGVGPFVPHGETPFANEAAGSVELTCYLLSILRIMDPTILLPATTALEALDPRGREKALCAGANVVMPNVSPFSAQERYCLYDGKPVSAASPMQQWEDLEQRVVSIGRHLVVGRGDPRRSEE